MEKRSEPVATEAVIDVVDALIQKKRSAKYKLTKLSREELNNIVDILRDAEVELMDRELSDEEINETLAMMEQAEINAGRF